MVQMSPELWERIPAEAQAIFLEMAETIARLQSRVEELEARLGMNPQNSSVPPSSEHPHAKKSKPKRKASSRKRGGQKGHKKHQRTLVPPEQVTETIPLWPPHCRRLKECAQRLFHHWHRFQNGTIARATMKRNIGKLWWPVYEALEAGTLKLCGKQAGMCQHILARVDHLWTFLNHEGVEPTNNASERSLRHAVIWRKLSFGTQSANGSRFVETLLSVIETCRQQNRHVFAFVTEAVQAHFNAAPAPKLLFEV